MANIKKSSSSSSTVSVSEAENVMRVARRLVSAKWRVLKLCSEVLDEREGWESNEMEKEFSRRGGHHGRSRI